MAAWSKAHRSKPGTADRRHVHGYAAYAHDWHSILELAVGIAFARNSSILNKLMELTHLGKSNTPRGNQQRLDCAVCTARFSQLI